MSDELWHHYKRGVTPLRARKSVAKPAAKSVVNTTRVKTSPMALTAPSSLPSRPATAAVVKPVPALDRTTLRRVRLRKITFDARLDLHGHSLDQAHRALARLLQRAAAQRWRCMLIITGKSGVLRRDVPLWLQAPPWRAQITALHPALAEDGGDGALYLFLRRRKDLA